MPTATPDAVRTAGGRKIVLDDPKNKRVIVVGAGIIGLATAHELLRRGWDVTVLDESPVSGATYAAAGMLAPVAEVVWDQPTLYPLMVRSAEMYPSFVKTVESDSGENVGYLTNQTLVCAGTAADRSALNDLTGLQRRLGMEVESITSSAARRMEPSLGPGCVGAVHIPGDHQVNPRRLAQALQSILGSRLQPRRVESLIWSDDKVVGVRCSDGSEVFADEVLVAAGAEAGDLVDVDLRLRPVHGEVLRLNVPEGLQPLVTHTVRGLVQGRPVYLVPRGDGTVVLGATSREDAMTGVSAAGVHQLLHDASHLIPAVLECEIYEMTTRARPGSPDDVPVIGRLADGLTVSTGYFRHGILLTPLGAAIGADLVSGVPLPSDTAAAVNPHRF